MPAVRVLLTGFGRFPGAPVNPSQSIINNVRKFRAMDFARARIDLSTAILPVLYRDIEPAIEDLLANHRPDIVLHMGLATRRKNVTLETLARNRKSKIHPDAGKKHADKATIHDHGPWLHKARWPVARLASSLNRFGIAAASSCDAGDYLCNQALYLSLGKHDGLCGFVHLPRPREIHRNTTQRTPATTRPALAELEAAIVWIIRQLAVEHRCI